MDKKARNEVLRTTNKQAWKKSACTVAAGQMPGDAEGVSENDPG